MKQLPARPAVFTVVVALAFGTAVAGVGVLLYAAAEANLWPESPDMFWLALIGAGLVAGAVPGLSTPRPPRIRLRVGHPPTS